MKARIQTCETVGGSSEVIVERERTDLVNERDHDFDSWTAFRPLDAAR